MRGLFQPRLAGWAGEAVAGEGGDHQVEGVGRVAAVGRRVGQRADHVEELDDRARPAVGEDQRQRVLGSGERTWRKWMFWPSIVVVNCGYSFSRASQARQS